MRSWFLMAAFTMLFGCSAKPLVIDWPTVQVETNLPLSRQGVVIVNGMIDSPRVELGISKIGYYGTSIVIQGLAPGGSIFVPADGGWLNNQTMAVVVTANEIIAQRDSIKVARVIGIATREFSFYNSGYSSRISTWHFTRYDLQ